jgi:hypothetical protein
MGARAQNQFSPEWFTPGDIDADDDVSSSEENPARFKVRGLTGSQQAEVMPECSADINGELTISGRAMSLLLKYGLLDWENFENDAGPVRFSKNARTNQDFMDYLTQVEVASKIFELSFPTEDDKKK